MMLTTRQKANEELAHLGKLNKRKETVIKSRTVIEFKKVKNEVDFGLLHTLLKNQ